MAMEGRFVTPMDFVNFESELFFVGLLSLGLFPVELLSVGLFSVGLFPVGLLSFELFSFGHTFVEFICVGLLSLISICASTDFGFSENLIKIICLSMPLDTKITNKILIMSNIQLKIQLSLTWVR